jgi:carbohydrate diacid regulator
MYELTRKQAQNIVDKMMKDIPYNINIMDQTGHIIGSGNKSRIGTLHHGAVEAIKQGAIVEIFKDEVFVQKGINLPIELNGLIVGVVGISGEVEETRPFGNLVRTTVILLIEQSMALEKENLKSHLKHEFFNLIINPDTSYTKELTDRALTYGIQLLKSSTIIYLESPNGVALDSHKQPTYFKINNHSMCTIVQEADKLDMLHHAIRSYFPDAYIAVSKMNDTIAEGFMQAKAAMRVLKGVFTNEKSISYSGCELIADMSKLLKNDPKVERLAHPLEKNDELVRTLQVYLNCNLNSNLTAELLMIHRNTLNYRLGKIHHLTGKDPKNILELVELIFMLINRVK